MALCEWRTPDHEGIFTCCNKWFCDEHLTWHKNLQHGRKDDQGKTRWDLLPWQALEEVAKVMTFGAQKYAPDNWRKVPGWRWRYFRAGIGHMVDWLRGEKLDKESGLHHLAHAGCCVLFLLELDLSPEA